MQRIVTRFRLNRARFAAPAHIDDMGQVWPHITNPFYFARAAVVQHARRFHPSDLPPSTGHSGFTGVVMYRCPERDITFTGSTNQIGHRGLPYRFMMRALRAIGVS